MPITISLNNIGKKYNKEWIFRGLTYEITQGAKLLILGGNGSGKSTLLQVISCFITPNEGTVAFSTNSKNEQDSNKIKNYFSFASPYLQLIEDFTLREIVEHIRSFKPFVNNITETEVIQILQMQNSENKFIRQFSSGMKQRLKLGLAILAKTPVLLLDEPVSNLDKNAIAWYKEMILSYTNDRTVIVCSNAIADEHFFCNAELNIMDYKITSGLIKTG